MVGQTGAKQGQRFKQQETSKEAEISAQTEWGLL